MKESESEVREKEEVEAEEEEEYVLLDLDGVSDHVQIPPNAPYVLSGLDTLNPILTIDDKIKLIGEYEETIGTCLVFNESDEAPIVHEEAGPSETNLFSGRCIVDPKQTPAKQVNAVATLNKVLKFRLFLEADNKGVADKQDNKPS
ncbi:general transcription factor 3C polypeptide 6 isoform X1 [Sesamum indicum]|uniref:General transcription factor 3C polypeptide 6 isoform X1 n=1 Tax=Sesamum indicum TaxID=4182 RepID=A0A6I9UTX0_SESIN|nr:general transcription factor 3C polypeptide 6 isoform X1 [Sesamum indicum]